MGSEVGARYIPSDSVPVATSKCRSMVFTLHIDQSLRIGGADVGPYNDGMGCPSPEEAVRNLPYSYLVYGREVCPSTGRKHLQG